MNDTFSPIALSRLLELTLRQLKEGHFFGIPEALFAREINPKFATERFAQKLATPLGVAAGPHTQLSQNIIAAWLCGARYIELKTVQTLDELNVSKPCIDMQDEGYNCEWSQELKIKESYDQYLDAWIMIHVIDQVQGHGQVQVQGQELLRELVLEPKVGIFNMSVGYNMEGILKENVQWFLEKMRHSEEDIARKVELLEKIYPDIRNIAIPGCISNNITLSTMHGCPPEEIETIGRYLIREKQLHTVIKLNPTLLGKEIVHAILNKKLGYKTPVPDQAFDHDLKFDDAVRIIRTLQEEASKSKVSFGIKLTNTLESSNFRGVLPDEMVYMSGRALHPLAVNLALKLQETFDGQLDISFSAGADCFNFPDLIACGLTPVTVCSDLLKPGGYGRLSQYLNNLDTSFEQTGATSVQSFILRKSATAGEDVKHSALASLRKYTASLESTEFYHKPFRQPSIKTPGKLDYFDCIHAPCVNTCPTNQEIPRYLDHVSHGRMKEAFETVFRTNPFPSVTGTVCDHECQTKCTRIHYDDPLAIREIKRFVADHVEDGPLPEVIAPRGKKVAIIGAGPAGLSCAYYLHIAGFRVTVFEAAETAGGTVASLIPSFRLPQESLERDIRRLINLGIQIHFHAPVDEAQFEKIKEEYEVVFVATGALKNRKLQVPGDDAAGVLNPLAFLRDYKLHGTHQLGKTIVVVGGGNTAMDAARTAKKILGKNGSVKILYRRTREDMPAEPDEIQAVLAEEIEIIELVNPVSIITDNAQVKGIRLAGMVTEGKGADGRNKVVPSGNPAFEMAADTIIPALGQESAVPFLDISKIRKSPDGYFQAGKNIFLGGDVARGGSNIISAIADGRKTAGFIIRNASPDTRHDRVSDAPADFYVSLMQSRSRRIYSPVRIKAEISALPGVPVFNVESIDQASLEASRCLFCDVLCNTCVTVCPNLANYHYHTKPEVLRLQKASRNGDQVKIEDHKVFRIEQVHQVLHIADFCNECGNCETFCPTSGAPFKDKPHFFLTIQSFNACDEGFMISKLSHATILIQKNHNRITTLSHMADRYVYETEELEATFDLSDFRLQHVRFRVPCVQTAFFETAAMMKVLLHGAEGLYTHQ